MRRRRGRTIRQINESGWKGRLTKRRKKDAGMEFVYEMKSILRLRLSLVLLWLSSLIKFTTGCNGSSNSLCVEPIIVHKLLTLKQKITGCHVVQCECFVGQRAETVYVGEASVLGFAAYSYTCWFLWVWNLASEIAGSNSSEDMDIRLLSLYFVVSVAASATSWSLIQRVPTGWIGGSSCVWSGNLNMRWPRPNPGCCGTEKRRKCDKRLKKIVGQEALQVVLSSLYC